MERHWNYGVKMFVNRNGAFQVGGQRPGQRLHSGILEQVNQAPQRAFVEPETGRMIEAAQAGTARRANSPIIERPWVEKRRIANGAEVIGIQRRRRSETIGADRNARPFEEGTIANAAIVREKQRKNSVGDLVNEIEGSRSRYRATREGAPPVVRPTTRRLLGVSAVVSAMVRLSKP
jgi:hypothetical protein